MNEETNKQEKATYITFSDKAIKEIKEHSDPTRIDSVTNERLQIATIYLPTKEYRNHHFEPDKNGIERDGRKAMINIVNSAIRDNLDENGKLQGHYVYLKPDRRYKVYFESKMQKSEDGTSVYDRPEPVYLTGNELQQIFKDSRRIAREKRQQNLENLSKVDKKEEKTLNSKTKKQKRQKKQKRKPIKGKT